MECNRIGNENSHPVVVIQHHTPDVDATDSSILPSGRVTEIRRQWALHEDEALAYRLQTEEITEHYTGNRSRNAIVREDGPKAREEQKKEEQRALELRFQHLHLLQQQAEEDSRYAKLIADREKQKLETNHLQGNVGDHQEDADYVGASNSELDFDILDKPEHDDLDILSKSTNSSCSSGAAIASTSSSLTHHNRNLVDPVMRVANLDNTMFDLSEEELKYIQQEKDEALARQLQDEMEQLELDRKLAVEAQDRELAKMIYDKEKARLKRAKERARLKAAGSTTNNSPPTNVTEENLNSCQDARSLSLKSPTPSSSSSQIRSSRKEGASASASPTSTSYRDENHLLSNIPPQIPEKTSKSSLTKNDPIGFRANPKPLPPQPESQHSQAHSSNRNDERDPIPPYMPMQGFNNIRSSVTSKKK